MVHFRQIVQIIMLLRKNLQKDIKSSIAVDFDLYLYKNCFFPCAVQGTDILLGKIVAIKEQYLKGGKEDYSL